MEVRKIGKEQLGESLGLVWEVFLQFVAPDYSEEGVKSFRDFMKSEEMIASLEFFGAYEKQELRGVIATNENRKHICLFFVKAQYHRQGIGRKLWEYVLGNSPHKALTVHASPYAVPIYRQLGFVETCGEQIADGMRFTPMKFERSLLAAGRD